MTTQITYFLPLGKSAFTSPCQSGIADGHAQDGSFVLRIPIHLGMSVIMLYVHFRDLVCYLVGIR